MDPKPLVDRRAVLRGAAALAGSVVTGAALTACSPGSGANPSSEAVVKTTARSGDGSVARARDQTQRPPQPSPPNPRHEGGDSGTPSEPALDPDSTGGHEATPDPDAPDGPHGSDGGGRDRPGAGHHEEDPGAPSGTGQGQGEGESGQDPGGPPPLVAVATIPIGGGVVLRAARVVVTQPVAGTIRCFGSRCTHRGCTVDDVIEGTIHCPCHGSLFDMTSGEPVAGPALSPLAPVSITVKSGGVYLG